jgi:UDP-N-acetylglucosamine 2-epimerase (non-hydrolysing)
LKPLLVFGARPNFMKTAPLYRAMRAAGGFDPVLVHTGQHFDRAMSDDFITALELPEPDVHLGVGPGSQAWQLGEIIKRMEAVLLEARPHLTVVVGDVSSTLAAALTSVTLDIPVAHVEAGLRSRDEAMPEERNRMLVDRVSSYLFTPSADAGENLAAEGIPTDRVFHVGNVMIDSLHWVLPRLSLAATRKKMGVGAGRYGVVTLHRPANVDDPATLGRLIGALAEVAVRLPLFFPLHPRTRRRIDEMDIDLRRMAIRALPPVGYPDFIALLAGASLVLTDSGGVQEEATVLGAPCLTLRDNTERPVTILCGGNELVGRDPERIVAAARRRLAAPRIATARPPLWDGRAAERIVDVLADIPPTTASTAGSSAHGGLDRTSETRVLEETVR